MGAGTDSLAIPADATLPQLLAARRKLDEQIALVPLARLLKLKEQVTALRTRVAAELAAVNIDAKMTEFAAMSEDMLRKALIKGAAGGTVTRRRRHVEHEKPAATPEAAPVTPPAAAAAATAQPRTSWDGPASARQPVEPALA